MQTLLVIGAGKIGSLIAFLLARAAGYQVYLADAQNKTAFLDQLNTVAPFQFVHLAAQDESQMHDFIKAKNISAIISCLPYFANLSVAKIAALHQLHYFDLTEDVSTTQAIKVLAASAKTAFIPQCGLAPGFISIIANSLMCQFQQLDTVKLRVGALPANISNALQYSLTWSIDGLINEYDNPCPALEKGKLTLLQPLEDIEEIKIDGLTYEAFNTSGGIGSLAETYQNKVFQLNYKTVRYPGHCEKMKFLMHDLRLNRDQKILKYILEQALPQTKQDVVLIFVSVTGIKDNQLLEKHYVKKIYPQTIEGFEWSAIQIATASSLCVIVDLTLNHADQYHGFIRQEQFSFDDFMTNRFSGCYN